MCWVALDCAIDLADLLGAEERVASWSATREQIRDVVQRLELSSHQVPTVFEAGGN